MISTREYKFTSIRWIGGRQTKVIVDICGEIINKNPTKEELNGIKKELSRRELSCDKDYLLEFLRYFYKKEDRIPEVRDFVNNSKYPSFATYQRVFGSWNKAINDAGFIKKKYKIPISKDGEKFFYIVVDKGILVKNPTDEDIKGAIVKSYNDTNICHRCREENNITDKSILYPGNVRHEKGKMSVEWICKSHYAKDYEHWSMFNDPTSLPAIRKSLADRRTGNLTASHLILADKCQKVTCELFGVDDLNKKNDDYNSPFDHSPIPKKISIMIGDKSVNLNGKLPQTKCRTISSVGNYWNVKVSMENNKKFDILIIYCISESRKSIERVYIFPKDEIVGRKDITMVKNPSRGRQWYEKYRVMDEDMIKKANDIWNK